MTEYDYSPQAYERYLATQNRIANWVDKTEQHRAEFQSANTDPPDLTRSGPGPTSSRSKLKRSSPPRRRQPSGQSQPKQLIAHPPPESDSSSDDYYEGPWPASMHQPMQQPPPPVMMAPAFVTPPHRVSRHHRHRSHDRRRSHSHHSPTYYSLASPPLYPGHQYTYPGGNQGYVMMPQTQMPVMVC
jgi:cell division septation protein DedD